MMHELMTTPYGRVVSSTLPYAEAVDRVKALLKEEGFGVLCEIDVTRTLREKIGASFRPYVILGACNPEFAHRALESDGQLGLLLPCNVVVQEEAGHAIVSAIDPQALLGVSKEPALMPVAREVGERLNRVLDAVAE